MRRAMRKPRSVSEGPNLLPLLIQVLASFTKADGVILEEEIDSSLVSSVTTIRKRSIPNCDSCSGKRFTSNRTSRPWLKNSARN